jgi:hypothetical protein
MARVGTPNLNLGTWTDNENPGAGSQTVDNTGLNGDKIKIDTAVGTGHNADGSHKPAVIDGPSLKTTAADGSTLELAGSPAKLRIKDEGITGIKLNASVVDNDSLQVSASTGAKTLQLKQVKAGKILGSGTGKAVDASTIGLNGSNELEVKDDAITSPKLSHDNTRTKILLTFATDPTTGFGVLGGVVTDNTKGAPMPRAGCITAVSGCTAAGTVTTATTAYSLVSNGHFAVGAKITVVDDKTGIVFPRINGSSVSAPSISCAAISVFVTLEIEFDD